MIKIDTCIEFRRGILFIRISGVITKDTFQKYNDEINNMIKVNGIKKVVLNLEKAKEIDLKGINLLYYTYEIVKENKGELYFTNINDNIKHRINKSHILKYVKIIENELVSYSLGGI